MTSPPPSTSYLTFFKTLRSIPPKLNASAMSYSGRCKRWVPFFFPLQLHCSCRMTTHSSIQIVCQYSVREACFSWQLGQSGEVVLLHSPFLGFSVHYFKSTARGLWFQGRKDENLSMRFFRKRCTRNCILVFHPST